MSKLKLVTRLFFIFISIVIFTACGSTDNELKTALDEGAVAPNAADLTDPNNPPIANAGDDQTVVSGVSVKLSGSNSSDPDGDALTYLWAFTETPAESTVVFTDSTATEPAFTAGSPGMYVIRLTINDGKTSDVDTVVITVSNTPIADAGINQVVTLNDEVTLNGTRSSDPNGDILVYSWTFVSFPDDSTAELIGPTTINPTFTADIADIYEIMLTVSDGNESSSDIVRITANTPPVADAGDDRNAALAAEVTLNGDGSTDPDGNLLSYTWSFHTRPDDSTVEFIDETLVAPVFTPDKTGPFLIRLTVSDGHVSHTDDVTITVYPPPVADAGDDKVVNLNQTVELDGTWSTDPDNNPLEYLWTFAPLPSGSSAVLINPTTATPSFTADITGEYIIKLIVSNVNTSGEDQVSISVNIPPVADAGGSKKIPLNSPVGLDGSGSYDIDGNQLTYNWRILTQPDDSNPDIQNINTVNPIFKADLAGIYTIELVVIDEYGASSSIDTIELFASGLPDTGQPTCYDDSEILDLCPDEGTDYFGQDASYNLFNQMSYTKLDENGGNLTFSAASWTMVRDNVTGLVWEVKTDDGLIHDRNNKYTWYNSDSTTNGGNAGTKGDPGTNTEDFISELNDGDGFGGYTDWRMPTDMELQSIVNYAQSEPLTPSIDQDYFPGTMTGLYWTSVTKNDNSFIAWCVHFMYGYVNYNDYTDKNFDKSPLTLFHARAVRGTSYP